MNDDVEISTTFPYFIVSSSPCSSFSFSISLPHRVSVTVAFLLQVHCKWINIKVLKRI
ncbi:hypothetical protein Lalb_Chr20g0122761 [Lupinus albus]|uniref:Uncharacterized protein n=1 Tax=Lupinus albus TaxID=3870 RepID=A0A6A4NS65_LUPAL|nr:hypothetical protein Lalb_Chr20g0122761 [Lupinus albus]